jgi:GrpB-like predicted nucleotidyltransferase (UPF0157 family)
MSPSPIVIVEYRHDWVFEFRTVATILRDRLGPMALRIDHIGSTSVAGLAAKDVIDIQVSVEDLDAPGLVDAIGDAGFLVHSDIVEDHRPPDADGPASDWRKRFAGERDGERATNLHVRVAGRPNQRYALLFRDYLRVHSPTASAYANVKRELARHHQEGRDAYVLTKDPVCDLIMVAAGDWAARTSWVPGPSDA